MRLSRTPSGRRPRACLTFLALVLLCAGRPHALAPEGNLGQLSRRAWQTEQGLPQNTVHSVVQDFRGYVWVATEEGIARFDGLGFTVFDRQNTPELRSNDVRSLLVTRDGNLLWASTAGGLSRFDGSTWTTFTVKNGLAGNDVVSAFESRDGAVWVATSSGLSRFKDGAWKSWTTRDGLPDDNVQAVSEDLSGTTGAVWVGTPDGLSRFDGGKFTNFTTEDGLPGGVSVMQYGPDGGLWLGTPSGLSRYEPPGRFTNYTTREGLPNDRVISLGVEPDGGLWVGTAAGAAFLELHGGRFKTFSAPDALSEAIVLSIDVDREGSVWLGTEAGGLHQLRAKKFTTYTTREGLTSDLVKAIYETAAGDVWVGTYGAGLNLLRGGHVVKTYTTNDGLPSNIVLALFSDPAGDLWVGTPDGLSRLRAGRFETFTSADGLPNDFVRSIYADRGGRLWVGTRGGLARLEANGEFTAYTTRDGLTSDFVGTIYEDAAGNVWVGTLGGLSKFADGRFTSYTSEDGLPESAVIAIHGDAEGRVWVGTNGGGLGLLEGGRVHAFTSRDGLPNDTVYRILEDSTGRLWMSCKKGIFSLPKSELVEFAAGRAGVLHPVLYDTADGMPTRECSGGGHPSGWRGRDGKLWFTTIKGVAMIDPERVARNSVPPPVVVEEVRVDGEPVAGTPTLAPGSSRFDFHYAGLSFVAPEKVRYRYKLEGFDKDWVEGGDRRVAYYTNLGPGEYTFRVVACNNDGVWSEAPAAFSFTLRPHFYRTYWFYALCALGLALVAWQLYALRLRQIRARFDAVLAERNRIAREIHDNLAQEILGISVQLEIVARLWTGSAEAARTHLDRARGLVRSSIAEARRYVWDLRSQSLEERDLPAALAEMTRRLTADSDVQTQFQVSGTFRPLPQAVENNLLRIGQEAVNNAVRHARARTVSVNLSFDATSVRLSVKDDGRGFDAGAQANGRGGHFGIVGMRERAAEMGGSVRVESAPGEGCEVTVSVPVEE
ncbi:MAG TPA: two-component regulator propeller domain-containing protein [Pyrinomonadaceae bacterium]|jgi:ligand-binding sensor domain-containing protein/signal transduction histidine kinase|nr:two-component regulator propeller domain-containing protein [Pyrinomonadaceae bacterium]